MTRVPPPPVAAAPHWLALSNCYIGTLVIPANGALRIDGGKIETVRLVDPAPESEREVVE